MCLICVEYYYKRMTKDEVKNALPEMVMFAKTEEERAHYKKLQTLNSSDELDEEVKQHVAKSEIKYDYQASYKYTKTRRS
jgi:hypothetical protein